MKQTLYSIPTKCFTCAYTTQMRFNHHTEEWTCEACNRVYPVKYYKIKTENQRARKRRLCLLYGLEVPSGAANVAGIEVNEVLV